MNDLYHQQVKDIFKKVFETQKESIIKSSTYGFESVSNKARFYALGTGHSHLMPEELYARFKGTDMVTSIIMPEFMLHQFFVKSTTIERLASYADIVLGMYPMEKGDTLMLVSNSGRNGLLVELALRAKEKGVNLITCTNYSQAQIVSSRHASGKNMIDFADVIIDNCGEYGDACHEVMDGLKMGSTSNMVITLIAQMINAVLINLQEGHKEDNMAVLDRFEEYFWEFFNETTNQRIDVLKAATIIFEAVEKEHRFFVYGSGHAHMITEELYCRAGGLAFINPILEDEIMVHMSAEKSNLMETSVEYASILMQKYGLKSNDVLLITSNSGKQRLTIELARLAKAANVKVIALTNVRQAKETTSLHPSGKLLVDFADVVIDNCSPINDAAFIINNRECCPLSTILSCYLAQCMVVNVAYIMKEHNLIPPVLVSANIEEGQTEEQKRIKQLSAQEMIKFQDYFIYQGPRRLISMAKILNKI